MATARIAVSAANQASDAVVCCAVSRAGRLSSEAEHEQHRVHDERPAPAEGDGGHQADGHGKADTARRRAGARPGRRAGRDSEASLTETFTMSAQTIRQTATLTAVGLAGRTVATKRPPCAGGCAARLYRRAREPTFADPSFLFKVDTPRPALESRSRVGAKGAGARRADARRRRGACAPAPFEASALGLADERPLACEELSRSARGRYRVASVVEVPRRALVAVERLRPARRSSRRSSRPGPRARPPWARGRRNRPRGSPRWPAAPCPAR